MLHGQIMVNQVPIGYWSARRTGLSRLDGTFEYETDVTMNQPDDPDSRIFTGKTSLGYVWHRPDNGALALCAAVLTAAVSPGPGIKDRG